MTTAARTLLTLCLTIPGAAQAWERASEGPLAGVAHAMSVASGTSGPSGSLAVDEVYLKSWGFVPAAPSTWTPLPGPPRPDFRASSILAGASPRPDLDACSIGLDWIISSGNGEVYAPAPAWAALTFSVTRATVGEPPTAGRTWGRLWDETRTAVPDGAAADLFSYVLPGSALPAEWVDVTQRAQDSTELNAFAPNTPGNIDAHDVFMPLYQLDGPVLALLPAEPRFYFSVTPATVALVPVAWWKGTTPSAATILACQWSATTQTWSVPQPFLTYAQLSLAGGDDLDALAVDEARRFLLFSTTSALPDPVMFANWSSAVPAVSIYRMAVTGEPITRRIGLGSSGDVDAICSIDPGPFQFAFGRPFAPIPGVPHSPFVDASAFRANSQQGPYLHACLTGWPQRSGIGPGFAVLFVHPPGQLNPILQLVSFPRTLTSPWGGDPRQTNQLLRLPPVPLGFDVDLLWGVANQALNDLDTTLPVRIRI